MINCADKLNVALPTSFTVKKPSNRVKCDIIIEGEFLVCISLKTVTSASFHQLDRRWLTEWKSKLDMPNEIFNILQDSILRKARNPRAIFILPEHRETIRRFLQGSLNVILKEIFIRDENDLRILAIWDVKNNELCMFNIQDVISFLSRQQIDFSNSGIIKIGKYITIQRKGGNGSHVKIPKTDPSHPGNQLQFKFKPLEFMKEVNINKCCITIPNT